MRLWLECSGRPASTLAAIALYALAATNGPAAEEDPARLLEGLRSTDPSTRFAAAADLRALGPPAVVPLSRALGDPEPAVAHAARVTLEEIARQSSSDAAGQSAVEAALREALQRTESPSLRSTLIDVLGIVATADSVPALSKALSDEATLEAACRALSRVPSPDAATAVREAIEGGADLDATARVALLNALGAQRDLASAQLLADTAEMADEEEAQMAALGALAINPLAYAYVHVFWGVLPDADDGSAARKRRRVWSCLLKVGESFIEAGEIGMASDLYCELLEAAATLEERCGAIAGCGRAGRRAAPDAVYEALDDENPVIRAAALEALGEMRGIVVPVIEKRLASASASRKAELLEVLGRRPEPEAAAAAARSARDPDPSVRKAALDALEGKSSGEAAKILVTAILEGAPVAGEGAAGVLARMEGDGVTRVIRDAVSEPTSDDTGSEARAKLRSILAARTAADSPPRPEEAANDRKP